MRKPAPLPDGLVGRAFSVEEARRLGLPDKRLRSKDLSRPYQGVRGPGALETTLDRALAYAPRLSSGQYFSHMTAAELLKMRTPTRRLDTRLHVTSVHPRRAPRLKDVVGHEVRISAPVLHARTSPLVCSDYASTWMMLAEALPLDDLVVMGDGLISRRHPPAVAAALEEQVMSGAIRRGLPKLREALTLMRSGTDSAPETRLRLLLVRAGLPEPEVNGLISTASRSYHGDLVFREARVVVEYDGAHHRTDETQFSVDVDRLDRIMEAGWRAIRVDRRLMNQPREVIRRVTVAVTGLDLQNPPK